MKYNLLIIASLLSLVSFNQAIAMPKPTECPSVSALIAGGLVEAGEVEKGKWGVGVRENKYDTDNVWTFAIGKIPAANASEAMKKALELLPTIKYSRGPMDAPIPGKWMCLYSVVNGYTGVTVTPPMK